MSTNENTATEKPRLFDFVGSIRRRPHAGERARLGGMSGCGSRSRRRPSKKPTVAPQKPRIAPGKGKAGKKASGQEDGPACRFRQTGGCAPHITTSRSK